MASDDPVFVPSVFYEDPKAAVSWLEAAFGFELTMAIEGPDGDPTQCHYELSLGGRGRVMVGGLWAPWIRSPASSGGAGTQSVHVSLADDIEGHRARAADAGAVIEAEPEDQFYGDRVYRAVDPEGHRWTFSVHVRDVSRAEAEQAIGQPVHAPHWDRGRPAPGPENL